MLLTVVPSATFLLTKVGLGTERLGTVERVELTGGDSDNLIDARSFTGSVMLAGGNGNDTLIGGTGSDLLVGGDGLAGLADNDTILAMVPP